MNTNISTFTLTSNDIEGQIKPRQAYNGNGCRGENVSPRLSWVNAPENTQSFAVTMYDPDAPTGSGWWHWLIFNIPADVYELAENAGNPEAEIAPAGTVQSFNDFGQYGYDGPCPPEGDGIHAYIITVYALDIPRINLSNHINPAAVGFALHAHTIQKASLISYFER